MRTRAPYALCALIAICHASCSHRAEPRAAAAEATPAAVRVAVTPAFVTPLTHDLNITAEFRPYQEVDVMAKISGYLNRIDVDTGSRVKTGQVLALVEAPEMADDIAKNAAAISRSRAELERSKEDVRRAETAREMTQVSYARLAQVSEKRPGLVAQQEIDTVRNRDLLAQSQIAAARSTLQATEQSVRILEAEAARLKTLQAYLTVTAPFDGVVTKRFADTGAMVQAGSSGKPIVRIAQIHVLRLVLPAPESVVARLRLGMAVDVTVESLGRTFGGRIARFSNQIQTATRTMDTEVDVPNPTGVLIPGMFAQARLLLEQKKDAVAVPVEAVDHDGGKASVLMVVGGKLERREIRTGMETSEAIEVLDGLREGDPVVLGNRSQLRPGQQVEAKETPRPGSKVRG